jgi:hypothetical protein
VTRATATKESTALAFGPWMTQDHRTNREHCSRN